MTDQEGKWEYCQTLAFPFNYDRDNVMIASLTERNKSEHGEECPICYRRQYVNLWDLFDKREYAILFKHDSCGHSLCSTCITHLYEKYRDDEDRRKIKCPMCRCDLRNFVDWFYEDELLKYRKLLNIKKNTPAKEMRPLALEYSIPNAKNMKRKELYDSLKQLFYIRWYFVPDGGFKL